jgi:hypothetical protein
MRTVSVRFGVRRWTSRPESGAKFLEGSEYLE